ncbi:DUF420 domain-containing protein [Salarchaeum sp. JOR-1]|uniref:DUF420 domain-containing protein n=1 Tax=Salarchaeum sp. JOR-1 TaxID=2599399 RepID=UPI00119854D6|nr:DUF420 domain-containing protein [Salarchaeum sp. JOR-1]QDX39650.1 DUF420 domain-containing protein [Salarchaeum sp. JOR-1]
MAGFRDWARENPRTLTIALSILGYALVFGAFGGVLPVPTIGKETVDLFSHLIAAVNTLALSALLLGVYLVKQRRLRQHRAAMLTAFSLIMVFLVLYLWKVGGGYEKEIVIRQGQFLADYESIVYGAYLLMLAVHIFLSAVSVPVVLHAVVLGLTQPIDRLGDTLHPRVGRIAAAAWSLSLFLGVVTYWMLNHVYSAVPR